MQRSLFVRFGGDVEEGIKVILRASRRPVSTEVLSFLLGSPSYKVCQALGRLERWGEVRKVTCSRVGYWVLK